MNSFLKKSHKFQILKNYFKKLDLTGVKYQPKIFNHKKFVSIPGALITLLCISLILYRIIMSIKTILNKNNFKVTTERDTELNINFTVFDLNLEICLMFDNPFSREGIFTNYYEEIKPEYIKRDIVAGYEIPCYYYNFSNNSFLINDDFFNSLKSFIAYFNVPENSSYYDVLIFYNICYINPNDFFHPIKYKKESIILGALDSNPKDIVFYMDKIKIIHHNKLFSFFYNSIHKQEEEYSSLSSHIISTDTGRYYDMRINIEYTGWVTTYTFIGFNCEEELSSIGGLISIISIIQKFIGKLMNKLFLNWKIKKHSQFSEESYNYLIGNSKSKDYQNFGNYRKNKEEKGNNNYNNNSEVNLKVQEKNINEDNQFKSFENIINHDIITINKNNKSNNDNLKLNENNSMDNISKNNNNNNHQKKVPEGKSIDFDSKKPSITKFISNMNNNQNFNNEEKFQNPNRLNDNSLFKSKKDFEYKQFIKLLDYYIIYQMIKDVNLLKLLCLNHSSAQIFYRYRYKDINISLLDNIMEKEIKNSNINDVNMLFDNLYEKINLLKYIN